jgi:hypothetical protein
VLIDFRQYSTREGGGPTKKAGGTSNQLRVIGGQQQNSKPNIEILNPKQVRITEIQMTETGEAIQFGTFEHSNFDIV